ncbi:hypothetical protein AC578_8064 [Pseudocercospora eumusae]|uniref:F-box domain-containing protein n=1 Tax=Pseudocercospora eumusae TaxID=321146 RepID=A0A139H7R5_9PEZI|nr:hypothetical protein AC578_8064 [Pseudocercospora eumusae]
MASINQANQARDKVLGVSELFEQILLQLPPKQLFALQRVSRHWKANIQQSPSIQRACFLRGINDDDKVQCSYDDVGNEYHSIHTGKRITPVWNCLTPCDLNLRPWVILPHDKIKEWVENDEDASWKEMFITQPPCTTLEMGFWYEGDTFETPGIDSFFKLSNEKGLTFMDIFVALYQAFEDNKSCIEGVEAKKRNPFRQDTPHWSQTYMEELYWDHVSRRTDWLIQLDSTDLRNLEIKLYKNIHQTSTAEVLRQMAPVFVEKDKEDWEDVFCADRPKRIMDRRIILERMGQMGLGYMYHDPDIEEDSEESEDEAEDVIDAESEHEHKTEDKVKDEIEDEDEDEDED